MRDIKSVKEGVFVFVFLLIMNISVLGQAGVTNNPPKPFARQQASELPCDMCSPPDMPINDHLIPILLISLLFGAYMIYRYNQKQKNPV